jgi:hypothetical protein
MSAADEVSSQRHENIKKIEAAIIIQNYWRTQMHTSTILKKWFDSEFHFHSKKRRSSYFIFMHKHFYHSNLYWEMFKRIGYLLYRDLDSGDIHDELYCQTQPKYIDSNKKTRYSKEAVSEERKKSSPIISFNKWAFCYVIHHYYDKFMTVAYPTRYILRKAAEVFLILFDSVARQWYERGHWNLVEKRDKNGLMQAWDLFHNYFNCMENTIKYFCPDSFFAQNYDIDSKLKNIRSICDFNCNCGIIASKCLARQYDFLLCNPLHRFLAEKPHEVVQKSVDSTFFSSEYYEFENMMFPFQPFGKISKMHETWTGNSYWKLRLMEKMSFMFELCVENLMHDEDYCMVYTENILQLLTLMNGCKVSAAETVQKDEQNVLDKKLVPQLSHWLCISSESRKKMSTMLSHFYIRSHTFMCPDREEELCDLIMFFQMALEGKKEVRRLVEFELFRALFDSILSDIVVNLVHLLRDRDVCLIDSLKIIRSLVDQIPFDTKERAHQWCLSLIDILEIRGKLCESVDDCQMKGHSLLGSSLQSKMEDFRKTKSPSIKQIAKFILVVRHTLSLSYWVCERHRYFDSPIENFELFVKRFHDKKENELDTTETESTMYVKRKEESNVRRLTKMRKRLYSWHRSFVQNHKASRTVVFLCSHLERMASCRNDLLQGMRSFFDSCFRHFVTNWTVETMPEIFYLEWPRISTIFFQIETLISFTTLHMACLTLCPENVNKAEEFYNLHREKALYSQQLEPFVIDNKLLLTCFDREITSYLLSIVNGDVDPVSLIAEKDGILNTVNPQNPVRNNIRKRIHSLLFQSSEVYDFFGYKGHCLDIGVGIHTSQVPWFGVDGTSVAAQSFDTGTSLENLSSILTNVGYIIPDLLNVRISFGALTDASWYLQEKKFKSLMAVAMRHSNT